MRVRRTNARGLQLVMLALLVVCAAQVGWWILDQWLYMQELSQLAGDAPEWARVIERDRRMNRYLWEGSFFLLVLLTGMGVLARAVRREAQLRYRQHVFLASVSHELRSPLATSRAAAETLRLRDPEPEVRRRLVDRVLRQLRRLEDLVANLLEAARIEEGEIALRSEPVVVEEAFASLLAAFGERAEDAGVRFAVDLGNGLRVLGDREALRTVLRNLLDNAFKAVRADAVAGAEPSVSLTARGDGRHVRIVVEDTGHGFDSADRERLFERFWRPGDEMRRGGRGAGLGLHIARELATRSGASLTAHSDGRGKGARFVTEWPAVAGHAVVAEAPE